MRFINIHNINTVTVHIVQSEHNRSENQVDYSLVTIIKSLTFSKAIPTAEQCAIQREGNMHKHIFPYLIHHSLIMFNISQLYQNVYQLAVKALRMKIDPRTICAYTCAGKASDFDEL